MRLILISLLGLFPQSPEIEALVRKLEADEIVEREAAMKELVEIGEPARPLLEKAAAGSNTHVAAHARATLRRIELHYKSVGPGLERIWKEDTTSLHKKVRDSMMLVRDSCQGQDAEAVEKSFERHGIRFLEEKYRGNLELKFVAKAAAYTSPGGIRHDLILLMEKLPMASKTRPTFWKVTKAGVALVAKPKLEFSEILERPYPEGSLLRRAFDQKSVRDQAPLFPWVEEIKLFYELPFDPRGVRLPWVFHVELNLATPDRRRGVMYRCSGQSGLDPDESPTGEKFQEGFQPSDAIPNLEGGQKGGWGRAAYSSLVREGVGPIVEEKRGPVSWGAGDLKALPDTTESIVIDGSKFQVDVDGEGYEDLPRFSKLRSLEWSTRKRITGSWVELVCRIKTLESLKLFAYGSPTDEDLRLISTLTGLKSLCLAIPAEVTDAGAAHLAKLTRLTRLELHGCGKLTDAAMGTISGVKNLEKLELWDIDNITDEGVRSLSNLIVLKSLVLSQGKLISATGWSPLQKLQSLQTIHLRRLSLNDEGFAVLGKLGSLEEIQLTELEHVSDAGLASLKTLKNLRRLSVWMSPKITQEGMADLQSALPGKYTLN